MKLIEQCELKQKKIIQNFIILTFFLLYFTRDLKLAAMANQNNTNRMVTGWISTKRFKAPYRKLIEYENCKIDIVDYNKGQLIASCKSCELQSHRLEIETEHKNFILEKLNIEIHKCISAPTSLTIFKIFNIADFDVDINAHNAFYHLHQARNKCTLACEEMVRNLKRDYFGKRRRMVCKNNNYSCVASIHDVYSQPTKTVAGYEFTPKTKIVPITCAEQACKKLIREKTMDDFELDELIAAMRSVENNCILFRHKKPVPYTDTAFSACDIFLYYFLKKSSLPFTFNCEKMQSIINSKHDYQLWCKCHIGFIDTECIITNKIELNEQMKDGTCCLLCNSFAGIAQQMKEITRFKGHFSNCKYFFING